ncbi:FMRFamide receptor-like [Mizuhopecten yessoensis]|uniref:FMRFamide receptor n=1 Tax=Mizuhopecten yessoensis TaxID=6573 RepID=A0A210Q4W9_MIZYE|nr:FMRFamide receptor-like [Mizuhopecten yessoensis]OWF43778.1 FMRFamide receptor [Mizuhopecten yessoensis]
MNIPISASRPDFVPPNSTTNDSTFLIRRDYLSKLEWPALVHATFPVIIPMLLILGIIGNSLTIAVLWHKKMKCTTTILLFRALAVTDMVVSVVWSLNAVSEYYLFQIPEGRSYYLDVVYPCIYIVLLYLIYFFRGVNIWITVTLCAERFIFVCVYYKANVLCTKKRVTIILAIITGFFFVFSIQQLIEFKPVRYPCYGGLCYINHFTEVGKSFYYSKGPFWFNMLMYNIFPTLLLISLSIPIICKLCAIRKKRVQMKSTTQSSGTLQRKEANVTVVLLLIVLFSVLSNLNGPYLVAVYVYNIYSSSFFYLICIFNTVVVFNSSINFVIYGVVGMRFRKILIKILREAYYKVLRKPAPTKAKPAHTRDETASSGNVIELTSNDTTLYNGI